MVPGGFARAPDLGGERLDQLDEGRTVAQDERDWDAADRRRGRARRARGRRRILEWRRRKRLPPAAQRPMAEFERALRRARYDQGEGLTLTRMERRFAGWPGAAGYVRALREQRYWGATAPPTADAAPRPPRGAGARRRGRPRLVGAAAAAAEAQNVNPGWVGERERRPPAGCPGSVDVRPGTINVATPG